MTTKTNHSIHQKNVQGQSGEVPGLALLFAPRRGAVPHCIRGGTWRYLGSHPGGALPIPGMAVRGLSVCPIRLDRGLCRVGTFSRRKKEPSNKTSRVETSSVAGGQKGRLRHSHRTETGSTARLTAALPRNEQVVDPAMTAASWSKIPQRPYPGRKVPAPCHGAQVESQQEVVTFASFMLRHLSLCEEDLRCSGRQTDIQDFLTRRPTSQSG
jgi:hypothetical protein